MYMLQTCGSGAMKQPCRDFAVGAAIVVDLTQDVLADQEVAVQQKIMPRLPVAAQVIGELTAAFIAHGGNLKRDILKQGEGPIQQ